MSPIPRPKVPRDGSQTSRAIAATGKQRFRAIHPFARNKQRALIYNCRDMVSLGQDARAEHLHQREVGATRQGISLNKPIASEIRHNSDTILAT